MKNICDYKILYNEVLKDSLNDLEYERIKAKTKILKVGFIFGIIILSSFFGLYFLNKSDFFSIRSNLQNFLIYHLVFLALCIITLLVISNNIIIEYRKKFKELIISKIVFYINNNLKYEDENYEYKQFFQELLVNSSLFRKKPNDIICNDFFVGKISNVESMFCEVQAAYSNYFTDESYSIFRGIFFYGDFNKNFNGKVVLLPNKVDYLKGNIIELEDTKFNKWFVVYGTDEITSRYVLSMSLMERITKFCEDTNKQLYISFVDSKVYIGIPYTRDLFEAKISETILNEEYILEFYKCIELAVSIIEELNLNCSIWET